MGEANTGDERKWGEWGADDRHGLANLSLSFESISGTLRRLGELSQGATGPDYAIELLNLERTLEKVQATIASTRHYLRNAAASELLRDTLASRI